MRIARSEAKLLAPLYDGLVISLFPARRGEPCYNSSCEIPSDLRCGRALQAIGLRRNPVSYCPNSHSICALSMGVSAKRDCCWMNGAFCVPMKILALAV